tara:strand:- start:7426 stop:8685 length:1260 start_codon:yes stop_codon:yes gene_type:complete
MNAVRAISRFIVKDERGVRKPNKDAKPFDSDEDDLADIEQLSDITIGPPIFKNQTDNDFINKYSKKLDEIELQNIAMKDEKARNEHDIERIGAKVAAINVALEDKEKTTTDNGGHNTHLLRQLLKRSHDVHIDNLIRRLQIEDKKQDKNSISTDAEEFRFQAYVLFIQLRRWLKNLNEDKSLLRQNQRMLSLKYHGLKNKIDFIQISVIAVATMITFVDTAKQYIPMPDAATTIVPIIMSTYIGFIIAISRFYKWEDTKEKLTKLNEKLAININQLWKKIKFAKQHKNIEPSTDWKEYFKRVHEKMQDLQKDGSTEEMIQLKQDIDIIMDYRETLVYKNKLSSLNLQDAVIQKKLMTVDQFKERIMEDKNGKIHKYIVNWHFPFNIFRDACFWARSSHISGQQFFKDNLYYQNEEEDFR